MFKLTIYDRIGNQLKEGDFVKISDGRMFTFFCEVKFIEELNIITPFHTFSFHSVEKIDKVPENAKESSEDRYKIYYLHSDEAEADEAKEQFETFLLQWRQCEDLIDNKIYRIERIKEA